MNQANTTSEAMARILEAEDGTSLVRVESNALEAITRSELHAQLDAAHRYPRSITKFMREATELCTFSREVAESCMYSVPRMVEGREKMITGPSVRLAEMCASTWGNLHLGSRVLGAGDKQLDAQAVAWDLERNVRITVEVQRSILTKYGKRYSESMIQTTGMAAISIAFRNAIFRVVPRAYVDGLYGESKRVAVGDASTLTDRRDDILARLARIGVGPERVFARLEVKGLADVTLEHIELLIGLGTSVKSGEVNVEVAFPPVVVVASSTPAPTSTVPAGTPQGQRVSVKGKAGKAAAAAKAEPAKAADPMATGAAVHEVAEQQAAALRPNVDLVELHELLAALDDKWSPEGSGRLLISWTEEQRRQAFEWADAAQDPTNENVPERPAWTILGAK